MRPGDSFGQFGGKPVGDTIPDEVEELTPDAVFVGWVDSKPCPLPPELNHKKDCDEVLKGDIGHVNGDAQLVTVAVE